MKATGGSIRFLVILTAAFFGIEGAAQENRYQLGPESQRLLVDLEALTSEMRNQEGPQYFAFGDRFGSLQRELERLQLEYKGMLRQMAAAGRAGAPEEAKARGADALDVADKMLAVCAEIDASGKLMDDSRKRMETLLARMIVVRQQLEKRPEPDAKVAAATFKAADPERLQHFKTNNLEVLSGLRHMRDGCVDLKDSFATFRRRLVTGP